MAATLIDTDVLAYTYDRAEPRKQRRALEVLDGLADSGEGRLSAQVLSEFFVAVTRKIAAPLDVDEARGRLAHLVRVWPVVPVTAEVIFEAMRGVQQVGLGFWDGQIWAAARLSGAGAVLSEDCNVGGVIEGVRFLGPFADNYEGDREGDHEVH